jgi:hypothetical protein
MKENKENNVNFYYNKYKKYKNKYILKKKYLVGGTKPGENPVIGVNIQELKKLLYSDINLKTISDDISYKRSTSSHD